MQEHAAKSYSGAVHEHELARYGHGALLLQRLVHREGLAPSVFAGTHAVGNGADAIVQQRAVDELRPDVEDVDEVLLQALEAPCLVGVHDAIAVVFEQALVEIDDAAHEARRKDADAAIIQQVDALWFAALREYRVIAQVRIAVDH